MVRGSNQQPVPWVLRLVLGKDFKTAMVNMFKDLREITAWALKNDYDSNGTRMQSIDRQKLCLLYTANRKKT